MRNLSESAENYFFDVVSRSGYGKHCGYEHFDVNTVLDVGNASVSPCHFRRKRGIAGVYVPEVVAADLRADPLAIRVLINRRFGRSEPFYEVAVSDSFRRAVSVLALKAQPRLRHVVGGVKSLPFFLITS